MAELRARFLELVLSNANNRSILDRAGELDLPDWWLTAGAVFQTVWNTLENRPPDNGIRDYDLFYFDPNDLSSEAEMNVNRRVAELFTDLKIVVEARNEARVHLWYEQEFGVPGKRFDSSRDAIDHFAATTCCFAVRRGADRQLEVYAPHGYADLLSRYVLPNPVLAPPSVYGAKTRRWKQEWPSLTVADWPSDASAKVGGAARTSSS